MFLTINFTTAADKRWKFLGKEEGARTTQTMSFLIVLFRNALTANLISLVDLQCHGY